MSVCLYLILNPYDPTIEPRLDGKVLFAALAALDKLAGELGVRQLQSFMDNRQAPPAPPGVDWSSPPDLKKDPEAFWTWCDALEKATSGREIAEPWNEWFDPKDGLSTVAALADRLESDEQIAAALPADVLVADLRELVRCLGEAQQRGITFRLEAW